MAGRQSSRTCGRLKTPEARVFRSYGAGTSWGVSDPDRPLKSGRPVLLLKPLLQDAAMIFALLPTAGIDPSAIFPTIS